MDLRINKHLGGKKENKAKNKKRHSKERDLQ